MKTLLAFVLLFSLYSPHPGNTDEYGCHTCRTNCESYGLEYGEYHCHTPKTQEYYAPTISYQSYCEVTEEEYEKIYDSFIEVSKDARELRSEIYDKNIIIQDLEEELAVTQKNLEYSFFMNMGSVFVLIIVSLINIVKRKQK